MNAHQRILTLSFACSTLILAGCGGGGSSSSTGTANQAGTGTNTGGNTGGNTTSPGTTSPGTIKTVQATVTTSNADALGIAAAKGIKKAVLDKETSSKLPKENRSATATGVDVSTYYCDAGFADETELVDGEAYIYSVDFVDCYTEGVTVNGNATETYFFDELAYIFEIELSETYGDGDYYHYSGYGAEEWSEDFNSVITYYEYLRITDAFGNVLEELVDSLEYCTGMNTYEPVCTISDDWLEDGENYRIEEAAVVGDNLNGFEVTAKVYDEDNGYIQVGTTSTLQASCSGGALGSGVATFTGAEGSTGTIRFDSCNGYTITVDNVSTSHNW
jgi:hypothetical protein